MDTFEKICEISNRLLVISIEQKKFQKNFLRKEINLSKDVLIEL
ncbi:MULTISPECIES: hypothetical protein [Enterococcus]|nr:hypothetical protein [Enterococcus thailandicus]MDT2751250.1 hypothetical protein [Enterococcus thailandicus]MDT2775423.1 hypothetical protein [Enterococcus thailandicus]